MKVLRRSWTEEERIKSVRSELGADCIRTTEDIARDVILARAQAGEITSEQLGAAGLRIGQREQFNIELRQDAPCRFGAQV